MAQSQLVRIAHPGQGKSLSKAQKEFNRLTEKIGVLENTLSDLRTTASTLQQRIQTEYVPLLSEYNQLRAKLIRLFDRAHGRPETTRNEKNKLADLIINLSRPLIDEHGQDELKPIFEKYTHTRFDHSDDQTERDVSETMKKRISVMYGITFDEQADISTHEKLMAYVDEQLRARQSSDKPPNEDRQKKPTSVKKKFEEQNTTKAVRMLYRDLVKTFHPDREPDENEKARKTEIMQRVTQAYEKSDLMALLRLQMEYKRIDQRHLETLAEEQLRYYNNILKQQVEELDQELFDLQTQLSTALGKPFASIGSALGIEFSFNNDIRELKRSIKDMKRQVKELSDPPYLKGWLKAYKI